MSERLIEIFVQDADVADASTIMLAHGARVWQESAPAGREKLSGLVAAHRTESLLRALRSRFGDAPGFSAIVMETEAVLPPFDAAFADDPETETAARPPNALERFLSRDRRSTDEIYDDIADAVSLDFEFLLTTVLSALIAALGMRSGQVAIIIGAMVIAPLLSPTLALAMSATVGNRALGIKAIRTLAVGAVSVLIFTAGLGLMIDFDLNAPELHSRTVVHLADIALALASGMAGVLALNKGASASLVGVMIAVALVPPLAAAGLYFSHGAFELALRALFLFATNLVCINIAGIAAFLLQGLPPKRWRLTATILTLWAALLLLFIAMITGRIFLGIAWTG
jgi:uncharacterized hydrophobic protein (TIGR00341 family)